MSRANVHDNSTDVSLFPFLAVLLCTMGSLLVVLVAVTRLSRDQAVQRAAAQRVEKAAPKGDSFDAHRKLQEAARYTAHLEEIRAQATQTLHDDQLRLSHVEDHIRRLQDQLESLQLAAGELAALEEEHYDDRTQAEREVARLQSLIEESREALER